MPRLPVAKGTASLRKPLIRELLKERQADLTAAERRLTALLQGDSMVAGLQSVTRLAERAGVSTPTVIRLARKLGFDGFPDLQDAIREEVAARIKQPLAKLEPAAPGVAQDHIVARFAAAAFANLNRTLERLDLEEFDRAADLLADPGRDLHFLGGRITRSNAHYVYNHLQIIRPRVHLLDSSPSVWPQALLDIDARSTLVIFDIRRYEKELERLAGLAVEQGAGVVLFTDVWGSPIERHAAATLRAAVEVPSSWDSTLGLALLAEMLIAEVQHRSSASGAERIATLERTIGATRIFRGP